MSGTRADVATRGTVAVVLNWNGAAETLRCLAALRRVRPRPPRTIVVDNGSSDDSVARIRAAHPEVELLLSERNLGFAAGINLGIRAALERGAERLLLLNNDVELDPDCLSRLEAELARDQAAGAAGPLILDAARRDRIWAAGGRLAHRQNVTELRGFGRVLNGRFQQDETVDYLPGCALLVRREALERAGLFEESYFCYMEDVEFGRRLDACGFRNRFVPGAVAYHAASSSTGGGYTPARKYMNAVNSVHFLRKHGTFKGWLGFVVFDVLLLPLAFLGAALRGRPGAALAKLRGLADGLRGVQVTPERVARYLREPR